jgi:hypothetical protein
MNLAMDMIVRREIGRITLNTLRVQRLSRCNWYSHLLNIAIAIGRPEA